MNGNKVESEDLIDQQGETEQGYTDFEGINGGDILTRYIEDLSSPKG